MITFHLPPEYNNILKDSSPIVKINVGDNVNKTRLEKALLADIFTKISIIPKYFLVFSASSMYLIEELKKWSSVCDYTFRKINLIENEIRLVNINDSEILFCTKPPSTIPYRRYAKFICSIDIKTEPEEIKQLTDQRIYLSLEEGEHIIKPNVTKVVESLSITEWAQRYLTFDTPCAPSKLHTRLDEILSSKERGRKILVEAPRGSAKSTYITGAYALKVALSGEEPYILLIGASWDDAKGYIQNIKTELEENSRINYDARMDDKHSWTKVKLMLNNGCTIQASAACGLRGRKAKEFRPSLIIMDDPAQDDHKRSYQKRKRLFDWFNSTVLRLGSPTTNLVVLGTAIHPETLVCELERNPDFEVIKFKEIVKWPTRMDMWDHFEGVLISNGKEAALKYYQDNKEMMNEGAETLWPERFPLVNLMIERCIGGHASFETERQNNPVNLELCEFLCLWDKNYFDNLWFEEFGDGLKVIYCDPSKGKRDKEGDYQCICKLEFRDDNYLYVDMIAVRKNIWDFLKEDLVGSIVDFKPDATGIEAIAFQELCIPIVRQFLDIGLLKSAPVAIEDMTNKQVRIRRLTWYIENRRIKFRKFSPGVQILIEQLRLFPDKNAHDDAPDALEGAHRMMLELVDIKEGERLGVAV